MLVVAGFVIAAAGSLPEVFQLFRTFRLRHSAGLSPITQASFLLSWLSWLTYGLLLADGPLVAASVIGSAVSGAMVFLLWRLGTLAPFRGMMLPAAGYAGACALLMVDADAGGAALAVLDVSMFTPQMLSALREDDISGISPLAGGWELVTSLGWVGYTLLSGIPYAGIYPGVYAAMLAAVAARMASPTYDSPRRGMRGPG